MLNYSAAHLSQAGYTPYYLYRQKYMSGNFENVGWSKPGAEGLYNIYIMEELHSILSVGAGGSTKLVDPRTGHIVRHFNCKYAKEYLEKPEKWTQNRAQFFAFERALLRDYGLLPEKTRKGAILNMEHETFWKTLDAAREAAQRAGQSAGEGAGRPVCRRRTPIFTSAAAPAQNTCKNSWETFVPKFS